MSEGVMVGRGADMMRSEMRPGSGWMIIANLQWTSQGWYGIVESNVPLDTV